jgi:hypothetical protein
MMTNPPVTLSTLNDATAEAAEDKFLKQVTATIPSGGRVQQLSFPESPIGDRASARG